MTTQSENLNLVTKAFRFQARPRPKQLAAFRRYSGCARYAWNWTVALCKTEWEQAKANAPEGEKPKSPGINRGRLYKEFCKHRDAEAQWLREVHSHVYSYPIERVVKTYKMWWQALKRGQRGGPPRFKPRGVHDSFSIQLTRWKLRRNAIHVPTIGWIEVWPAVEIPTDVAKPCTVTVSRVADKWYISIAAKNVPIEQWEAGQAVIGIDLGVNSVVTMSDGSRVDPPQIYHRALKRLVWRQRRLSRKKRGSANRQKAKMSVARAHAKAATERGDFCHQLTSQIVKRAKTIVIEGFDITGLVSKGVEKEMKGKRKRQRRQTILDHAWGEIRRQLEYKAKWHGREILICDKYEKTDKPCHACGHVNDVPKNTSEYRCVGCGLETTRQLNTALLLEGYGKGDRAKG